MRPQIASSIRLILAMFRLYADVESGFGRAILDILRKQFPDQEITEDPARVGHKIMAIARGQLQGNDADAMDAVQEFLTYIATGSKRVRDPETGELVERTEGKPWDFSKDFETWTDALTAIYRNVKTTAIAHSKSKMRKKTRERSVDEAFGRRTDAGPPEGGEERMPTGEETSLGKALDDKAAVKEFISLIDEHLPDLRASLSEDSRKLFDLIFEDEVGSFGSDIKENMGQATALKDKYPELYEKNAKRWSGFVGDLRKRLLDEIWRYIEDEMSYNDYVRLRDQFFADVDPDAVRKMEQAKLKEKGAYQRGLDERKLARLKAKMLAGPLSPQEQKDFDRISDRLKEQGVNVDAIEPDASAGTKKKSSVLASALLLSGTGVRPAWLPNGP